MSDDRGIKVILLGEAGVGKTNLIRVALGKEFEEDTATSLTSSFYDGTIFVDNKNYSYCLWDTAGQELYRAVNKIFIKDSKIVLIVFAINNKQSFEEIDFWYNYTNEILGEGDHIIALIANKSDLYEEKQVSNEEGEEFAKSIGAIFVSTSAKNASGINALFENIAHKIIDPTFDFAAEEKKKAEAYKKKKKKEKAEEDAAANNKGVKLSAQNLEKKKKACC